MNKNDLIASVASSAGLSKSDATRAIESFLDSITNALKRDEKEEKRQKKRKKEKNRRERILNLPRENFARRAKFEPRTQNAILGTPTRRRRRRGRGSEVSVLLHSVRGFVHFVL